MEDLLKSIKNISLTEKVLGGITLGGVLLNKIIPSEYVRLEVISLGIASLSSIGMLVQRTYNDIKYSLQEKDLYLE